MFGRVAAIVFLIRRRSDRPEACLPRSSWTVASSTPATVANCEAKNKRVPDQSNNGQRRCTHAKHTLTYFTTSTVLVIIAVLVTFSYAHRSINSCICVSLPDSAQPEGQAHTHRRRKNTMTPTHAAKEAKQKPQKQKPQCDVPS